jgi:hypothetical protein
MQEAIDSLYTPHQICILFTHLLVNDCINSPLEMWRKFHTNLAQDFLLSSSNQFDLALSAALQHISILLQEHGKSLTDFGFEDVGSQAAEVNYECMRWKEICDVLAHRASHAHACLNEGRFPGPSYLLLLNNLFKINEPSLTRL